MTATSPQLSADLLRGVRPTRGTLVRCGEGPTYDMIAAQNSGEILAFLQPSLRQSTLGGTQSTSTRCLFACSSAENAIRLWVAPFSPGGEGRGAAGASRKRGRNDSSSDSDDDDDM